MIDSKQLKALRKKHGLTQSEIAALVFQTKQAWSQYESGLRNMTVTTYELLKIKLKEEPN